ncbi:hypothetical protein OESDEN_14038 [Oesophagostomum dentatum]|uniref:G-protein coupled receptors family 1 profile domain-containing protein n=1 Tax=Oesophagostomum dentatum TaxID=61180 RepID=A0A0B1SSQ9_OESDE|nr:hypothetical protein OESDEN_14038 [Oesophagostomum dentatum]
MEWLSGPIKMLVGVDLSKSAYTGISMKVSSDRNPIKKVFSTELQMLTCLLGATMIFCALRIHIMLRKSTFSEHLLKLHRQLFTLLLLQTACPILFLHSQAFVTYGFIYAGLTSPKFLMYLTNISVSIYPLVNPLLVIGFVSDYRRRIMAILRLSRRSINSSVVSATVVSRFGATSTAIEKPL